MKIERRKKRSYIDRITAKKTTKRRLFDLESMKKYVKADIFKIAMESALKEVK